MIRFAMAETIMEARRLAREDVRQHWKEQGCRGLDYSQKELTETANELLRLRPELIDLACSNLSSAERNQKARKSGLSLVQISGSKWRAK